MPRTGIAFRGRLRGELGVVGQEIDLEAQSRTAWEETQHDADGGHTEVTAETMTAEGLTSFGGPWRMPTSAVITPRDGAVITSNQNDYNPRGLDAAIVIRIATDASRDITGLVTNKDEFRVARIINIGNSEIVLKHNSTASTSIYRFACPDSEDVQLAPACTADLWYDRHSANWRVTGFSGDWATIDEAIAFAIAL